MRAYIQTYTGMRVHLPGACPSEIRIGDIAHALSYAPRFAGHTDRFYSVAEHSINVAEIVPDEYKLQALLHDATEAYLCDIPTPYKRLLTNYKMLEDDLWSAISTKFGVPFVMHAKVKHADGVMLMTEKDALKKNTDPFPDEFESFPRVKFKNRLWGFDEVEKHFKKKFFEYGGRP